MSESLTQPDVSIVVVSYNSLSFLRDCFASLATGAADVRYEVWLVDSGSTDVTIAWMRENLPHVRLIVNEVNVGFAKGNNQALRHAAGRYILLLNPDTKLMPDTLLHMANFMEENPSCGIVGPQLLNPDGTLQPSGARLPNLFIALLDSLIMRLPFVGRLSSFRFAYNRYRAGRRDYQKASVVGEVSGAALMIRSAALSEIGYLDEGFFLYFEDVDWCRRATLAGWEVWYLPAAQVEHRWGAPTRRGYRTTITHLYSQHHYFEKHHGKFAAWLVRCLVVIGEVIDLVKSLGGLVIGVSGASEQVSMHLRVLRWAVLSYKA